MAKDPAFLFYPGDYVAGTMHLDFECKGAYIDLLMLQFQKNHMSIHMIKHMLGHRFETIWVQISDKFVEKDGLYWNERLKTEKEKRTSYSKSRSNNRNNKKNKEPHMSEDMLQHMENENVNIYNTLTLYSNGLSKFLKVEFSERNITDITELKYFDMVVVEMNKIWLKHKPNYSFMQETDYPALLRIAYLIAQRKKISKYDTVNVKPDLIVQSFDKISAFMANTEDKFFRKLTLDGIAIPKNFQKIEENMRDSIIPDKHTKLEEKRITDKQYFTD